MIRPCRCVLKELRKLANNTEDVLDFLGNTTCICRTDDYDKTYDYSRYHGEIHSIIRQLIADGYLAENRGESFTITLHGLHPYQFQWDSLKKFLFKSVLVPIVVSFVTSLIVLFLQG